MKRALLFAVFGVAVSLSACGGGGGGGNSGTTFKDPDQAQFTYGAATDPSGDEASAADSGVAAVGDVFAFTTEADAATAQQQVMSAAMLPNEMGDVFSGSVPFPSVRAEGAATAGQLFRSYLAAASAPEDPAWDDPGCWSLTAGRFEFDHCTVTESDESATMVMSVDGSLNRAEGRVFWDVTVSMSANGTDGSTPVSLRFADRLSGDISYTASTIAGFSRSDISISMSSGSERMSGAVTYNADLDLAYASDPFCVTGGTLTLKRLWAEVPQTEGADPAEFADASAQFTWLGCGSVNVAWGTSN